MSNKKQENPMKILAAFTQIMADPGFTNFFEGAIKDPEAKYPYERLGGGYELRPIEILAEGGQFVLENREKYSHLYLNGERVTDSVFRKGGMGGEFKDGYCELIYYSQREEHTQKKPGFGFGIHVIINQLGEIVLKGTGISSYPSHCGGNVGKLKDTYYDLRSGQPILTASSSGAISSKNYIIVQHRYDWYDKKLPLGLYSINKETCEVTKIDDIK